MKKIPQKGTYKQQRISQKNNKYKPQNLSEREFCDMLGEASKVFFKLYNYVNDKDKGMAAIETRRFYSMLIHVSETFESFLDEHGARMNKKWMFLTEIVASIRNISIAGFHLRHLLKRYNYYKLDEIKQEREEFFGEANKTIEFFHRSIIALFSAAKEELTKSGVVVTREFFFSKDIRDIFVNKQLKRDTDEEEVQNNEEKIVEMARRYRKASKNTRDENIDHKIDMDDLYKIIPLKLNENKMQKLKNILHGIQSEYDTYIKSTKIERQNRDLVMIRGHISLSVHLLMVLIMLSHFYERHESDIIRHSETREKIAKIVDRKMVLDKAVNFAFYYLNTYLNKGNVIAERLLTNYMINIQYELPIPEPLGFHARPSTYVSLIVNEHGTDVFMIVDGTRYNAKSVLALMEAGGAVASIAAKKVIFEGDKRVLDDIKILAEHNYCEDGNIPKELNYIRILRNVS